MPDIQTRTDIDLLVSTFYHSALADPLIGHFFTSVVVLDLEKHLPLIADFWEGLLLGATNYHGNTMQKHFQIHALSPLRAEHFERWLALWQASLHQLFEGPKTNEAHARAQVIAGIMQLKIERQSG